jgi:hypothetical protein
MNRTLVSVAAAVVPILAAAQGGVAYRCTNGSAVREVMVVYPQGGEVPCEVRYYKDAVPEVLWSAEHQPGYCEAQAREFVMRLATIGWTCSNATEVSPPPSSEPRDDTDVLGAGER